MGQAQAEYDKRLASGSLRPDAAQAAVVAKLDALSLALAAKRREAAGGGFFRNVFGAKKPDYRAVRGLYLYGKVGRGKTMLMDLFYAALPAGDKKRVHFNDFMADVQNRLAAYRRQASAAAPVGIFLQVAADLAAEAHILCFDEFAVTDIADAMILSRLFQALFARGVVLVATSNVAPEDLYKNGLNRALFLPFIRFLPEKAEICNLDAPIDYRLSQGADAPFPAYLTPADAKAKAALSAFWLELTGQSGGEKQQIKLRGRQITVPCAAPVKPDSPFYQPKANRAAKLCLAARFDFADIDGQSLAAADYAALAEHYSLFCLENVPQFSEENRNQAKRFILFIDTLYDKTALLCLSAAAPAAELYAGKAEIAEKFEFDRTASRLTEMQGQAYLRRALAAVD